MGSVLPHKPLLLGVVNTTPDSFSDGGQYLSPERAVAHGLELLGQGADGLDVGGESTRPGAVPVPASVELSRVVPVVAALASRAPGRLLSIDTSKAVVAKAALDAGATLVNDVTALADPGMGPLCAERGAQVVLMHMRGTPATMQQHPAYTDVVAEVTEWLAKRVAVALDCGILPEQIVLDPGLGFGKSYADNAKLMAAIPKLSALGYPVLIGASRKAFIGALTGVKTPADRVYGSIGAAVAAALRGARYLRVHDVAATRQALDVMEAIDQC